MVNFIIKSFSKGFFYTIGRIIAFIIIGLLIAYFVSKIDSSSINIKELAYTLLC